MADRVRIYEVGPRDGLQNESTPISTADKLRYIELLADAGLREIEATSFVSPRAIPQLADADELLAALPRRAGVRYPVLVPNERGLARAEAAGVDAIAVFTAATDAFTQPQHRDDRGRVAGRLRAGPGARDRARAGGAARTCRPRSGARTRDAWSRRPPSMSRDACSDLGVDEICFGDTIGVGVPNQVGELVNLAAGRGHPRSAARPSTSTTPVERPSPTSRRAWRRASGRSTARAGGTGGCPYAPGAAGNLATEDLVYFLDASGWEHGVSLDGVLAAARFIAGALGQAAHDQGRPGRRLGSGDGARPHEA